MWRQDLVKNENSFFLDLPVFLSLCFLCAPNINIRKKNLQTKKSLFHFFFYICFSERELINQKIQNEKSNSVDSKLLTTNASFFSLTISAISVLTCYQFLAYFLHQNKTHKTQKNVLQTLLPKIPLRTNSH